MVKCLSKYSSWISTFRNIIPAFTNRANFSLVKIKIFTLHVWQATHYMCSYMHGHIFLWFLKTANSLLKSKKTVSSIAEQSWRHIRLRKRLKGFKEWVTLIRKLMFPSTVTVVSKALLTVDLVTDNWYQHMGHDNLQITLQ